MQPHAVVRYPSLFSAADEASQSAQRLFSRLAAVQLVAPIMAALFGLIGPGWPRLVAVAMFALGLGTSIAMQLRRPERAWFDGRALAESIKTMAWRYVMAVSPYDGGDLAAADDRFHTRFKALIDEHQQLGGALAAKGAGPDITAEMRTLRALSLAERRDAYSKQRLGDQVRWYSEQARSDESRATLWLWLITILQLGGLVLASVQLAALADVNLLPVLAAVIAAAFAWLQLKRHQELAKAYGVAALELGTLLGRINECDSTERLAAFVEEAEEAMSREHTLWRARRT